MKKILLFAVTFILIGLVGCESAETVVQNGLGQMNAGNIVSITLKEDDKQSVKITEASSFIFVQAITAAEFDTGQLDIAAPDYGTTVEMKDGTSHKFSFWIIGGNTGLFIKSGQNGHYRLPDASKKDLLELFQSASKAGMSPPSMAELQVDKIQQITIMESNNGNSELPTKTLAVLVDKNEFHAFSDAIKNAQIATGEVIAIGANYDFVIEFATSQQRFSYWNGKHLKMISDHDAKTSYFLSDEATKQIDLLINEADLLN